MNNNCKSSLSLSPVIVTIANDNYSLALAVMLKSLLSTISIFKRLDIYILNNHISLINVKIINNISSNKNIQIHWIHIDILKINDLKVNGHIALETYFRLLIEDLLIKEEKVLFLDADIIINSSIIELWNYDINNTHLLAVPLASKKSGTVSSELGLPSFKMLNIPENTRTFNAGVMLINLNLWRKDSISNKIINYLRLYNEHVLWWDQDGLNAILYNNWKPLPAKWNVMTNHLRLFKTWEDSLLNSEEFKTIVNDPAIIHFAGPQKPWHSNYDGPYKELFNQYINALPSDSFKNLNF